MAAEPLEQSPQVLPYKLSLLVKNLNYSRFHTFYRVRPFNPYLGFFSTPAPPQGVKKTVYGHCFWPQARKRFAREREPLAT